MNSFWIFQRFFCLPRTDSNPGYCVDIGIPKTDQNGEVRPQRPCTLVLEPTIGYSLSLIWVSYRYRSTPWYKEEPQGVLAHVISKLQVWIGYHADVPSAKYVRLWKNYDELIERISPGITVKDIASRRW